MKIIVDNIAKVKHAEIEIEGISVIAGENNTGKSTIGKAVYSLVYSIHELPNRIKNDKMRGILEPLRSVAGNRELLKALGGESRAREFASYVVDNFGFDNTEAQIFVKNCFEQFGVNADNFKSIEEYSKEICEVLNISDKTILNDFVDAVFGYEFDEQVNSVYNNSEGIFSMRCNGYSIETIFSNNTAVDVKYDGKFAKSVTYVDDPFVLHNRRGTFDGIGGGHRWVLWNKLNKSRNKNNIVKDIRISNMLSAMLQKVGFVCSGDISFEQQRLVYRDNQVTFNVDNLSAGLKTFVILKTLLQNGSIGYGDIVVLDEPEIHLHPEWQIKFAEIIVLLQQTFGLIILINTHSPYFLDAIERFSEKYGIAKKCRYYMSEIEGNYATFRDVTGHIDLVYQKLVKPLDDMDGINNETN